MISPQYFLNFFSDLYIPLWLQKCFKFMVLRLLKNTFASQIKSVCSCPHAKLSTRFLSSPLPTEGNYPFPTNNVLKIYFSPAERGWTMELKIRPKLNLKRYWSKVLINFIPRFANVTFMVSVLLYHNLRFKQAEV